MNFGTILNSMTKTCVRKIYECKTKESKTLARDFIDYIYMKEVLTTQFRVYHNLNSTYIADKGSARTFVMETLNTLSKYSFEDVKAYNALLETKFKVPKMKSSDINWHIANLIRYHTSEEKTDQFGYVQSLDFVTEHVSTIREEKSIVEQLSEAGKNTELKFLKPQHVMKIAVKKFNRKYDELFTEDDRRVFNILKSGDKNKIDELRKSTIKEIENYAEIYDVNQVLSDELQEKLWDALTEIRNDKSQDGILFGHELLSELKELGYDG